MSIDSRGWKRKVRFSRKKNHIWGKKYIVFHVLLGSTCVQNLRQFEFLTLAIKISFLFDFCTDVLLKDSTSSLIWKWVVSSQLSSKQTLNVLAFSLMRARLHFWNVRWLIKRWTVIHLRYRIEFLCNWDRLAVESYHIKEVKKRIFDNCWMA